MYTNNDRKKIKTTNKNNTKVKKRNIEMVAKPAGATGAPFEYKMPAAMAAFYLKNKPKNIKPMEFLCDIVTDCYGLIGWCCRVIIEG